MVRKILKSIITSIIFILFIGNIYAYEQVYKAYSDKSNIDEFKFALITSAHTTTVRYYNGVHMEYDVKSDNKEFFTGINSFWASPFSYKYNSNKRTLEVVKDTQGFVLNTAKDVNTKEILTGLDTLPRTVTFRTRATLFHTKPGSKYGGSPSNMGYLTYTTSPTLRWYKLSS